MGHISGISDKPYGAFLPPKALSWIVGSENFDAPHPISGIRRKIAKRYLRRTNTLFDVTYRNLKLRLFPRDNAGDLEIAMYGRHSEEDELQIFEGVVAEASVLIDIGANIGIYSLTAAKNMKDEAQIISFEPAPSTRDRFEQNIRLNGFVERIEIVPAGVGPKAGNLALARDKSHNAGSASFLPGKSGASVANVPVVTLLEELTARGVTKIDVLKIDIEGFEDQALMPFFQTAPSTLWPHYLMLETCHRDKWQADLLDQLEKSGYTVCFENARNRHYQRKTTS